MTDAEMTDVENDRCGICLHDHPSLQLKCNHWFHSECMQEWTNTCSAKHSSTTCPLCRATVSEAVPNPQPRIQGVHGIQGVTGPTGYTGFTGDQGRRPGRTLISPPGVAIAIAVVWPVREDPLILSRELNSEIEWILRELQLGENEENEENEEKEENEEHENVI